jgi:hypothetical protein
VSLNNRISIRDTCNARGAVEIGACPGSGRSEITADFVLLESEKVQKQTMKHPQTEVKVVSERVISKLRHLRFTVFLMPTRYSVIDLFLLREPVLMSWQLILMID